MKLNYLEKKTQHTTGEAYENKAAPVTFSGSLNDKLLLAVKAAGIGVWEYCINENKFIADEIFLSHYGLTPAGFGCDYESWMQCIHVDDKKIIEPKFYNALLNDSGFAAEFRIICADGAVRYIKSAAVLQRDTTGKPLQLTGTSQDVTAAREAEQLLKESEAKYRSFFNNTMDGILITQTNGNITAANPAACAMLQMTEDEICKRGRDGLLDTTDQRLELFLHERSRTGKAKAELIHIRKDGTSFAGETTSAVYKDAKGCERSSIIIRNISDRKITEQKVVAAVDAMQQALNGYKKIIDSSLDVICTIDEDGRFVNISSASARIWGYQPHELTGKKYMDLVYKEDAEQTAKTAAAIISGNPVTVFENRYLHKNGTLVPVLWSARWDEKDKLMYCIAKDATEKKRLDKALETERRRFYDLFLQAPISIGILKGETHVYEMANTIYLQLIGKKSIIGKTVKEVLPEVTSQGFIDILDGVYKTGKSFIANEMLVNLDLEGNGKYTDFYLNILYQSYRNSWGEIEGIFFFTVDVTEQVVSRKKIEESEKRYRQILDTAQEGVWIIDENNKTNFINQKMCEMLGYTVDDIMGNAIQDFMDEEERNNSYRQIERRKKGISENHDLQFITKSGKPLWTNISTNPILDNYGKYNGALAMITDITERKASQQALNESEKKYRQIVETAQEGIWMIDEHNQTSFVNRKMSEMLGYGVDEMIGKDIRYFMDEEERKNTADRIKRRQNQISENFDLKYITKSGKQLWVNMSVNPVFYSDGKYSGALAMITDITERKKAEIKLLEKTEQLQKANEQQIAILNALPPHIALLDNEGKILAVNNSWIQFGKENGLADDYLWIGKNYIHASEDATCSSHYAKTIASNIRDVMSGAAEQFSTEYCCETPAQNKWFKMIVSPLMNKINEGAVVLHIDITERKLAEDKLQEKQEQLLASQRMAHIGSWHRNVTNLADIKSSPVICSEEALRIMGLPADFGDMSYEKFLEIVHPEDIIIVKEAALTMFKEFTSYYKIDHRIIRPDSTVRWVSRDAKFVKNEHTGKPLKIIGTIKDITAAKEQELQLQKSTEEREMLITELTKSVKDLQQYTYITSHNFRAPLTNLIGLLSLIDYSTLTEGNKSIVEMFESSTLQLNSTINDLVNILIIKNNVNLDIVDNNVSSLIDKISNTLLYEINEANCVITKNLAVENICFNKSYLESILINLLSNAIKYRSPNRSLQITISTENKPNGDVLMIIKDNGIGMDVKRHGERIFGLYQRFHTNADSVGLGLFMVKSQITALGGNIEVESEVDKGTAFSITFRQKKMMEAAADAKN